MTALVARNTAFNISGRGLSLLVGAVLMPFIVTRLGTQRFGVLSLAWTLVGYSSLFDLGMGTTAIKFISEARGGKDEETIPTILFSTVIVHTVSGVAGALILAALVPFAIHDLLRIPASLALEAQRTFYLLVAGFPIILVAGSFEGTLAAFERFDLINLVSVPVTIATFVVPCIVLLAHGTLTEIIGGLLLVRSAALLTLMALALRVVPFRKDFRWPDRRMFASLATYGAWLAGPRIVQPMVSPLDRILLTRWTNLAALAYYSAPYDMLRRLGFFTSSFGSALFPAFGALSGAGDSVQARRLFERSVKFLMVLTGVIMGLTFVMARDLLRWWLGPDFAFHGTLPLRILIVCLSINWMAEVPVSFLRANGRVDLPSRVELGVTILDLLLLYFLVRPFGISGAALAVGLGLSTDSILIFYFCNRICPLPEYAVRSTISIGLTVLCLVAGAYVIYNFTPIRLILRLILVLAMFAGMVFAIWRRGLDQDDRLAVKRFVLGLASPALHNAT